MERVVKGYGQEVCSDRGAHWWRASDIKSNRVGRCWHVHPVVKCAEGVPMFPILFSGTL